MNWPSYLTFITAIGLGLAYAGLVQGIFVAFRILNFPDLTVTGSIVLGAALSVVLLEKQGWSPLWTLPLVFLVGCIAGLATGFLTTKLKINGLLASILVATALYSINLVLLDLGSATGQTAGTLYISPEREVLGLNQVFGFLNLKYVSEAYALVVLLVDIVIGLLLWGLLSSKLGLAVRATGNNEQMARSVGIDTDLMKMFGIAVANGLTAISGALLSQQQLSANIEAGNGAIVLGLAGLILGEAFIRSKRLGFVITGAILGAVIYRVALALVLAQDINVNLTQLFTALLVVIALALPLVRQRFPNFTNRKQQVAGKVEG